MIILTSIIKLDNNYIIKAVDDVSEIHEQTVNIEKLKLTNILDKKQLLFIIDFSKIQKEQYKKILRKLLNIKKALFKRKFLVGKLENEKILLGYVLNYSINNKMQNDFITAINTIFYKTKADMYNYIYDTVCDYLDSFFYGKNLCDFKNNKCGEKRLTNSSSSVGCCRHYKNKLLGPLIPNNLILCEHLKEDNTCGAKCIGCKLFTCDYLEKKGIKFKIKDILLLDVFFNPLQKYFIKTMVFRPKEEVIKRLLLL